MRSFSLSVLVLMFGCADTPAPPVVTAATRQAVNDPLELMTPVALGSSAGAHLGESLAACPDGGWLAGGPGTAETFSFPSGMRHLNLRNGLALPTNLPVACDAVGLALRRTASGVGEFTELLPDGGRLQLDTTHFDSLATSRFGLPLVGGSAALGKVVLFSTTGQPRWGHQNNPTFGTSVAWNRNGGLVVGNPGLREAKLLFFDPRDAGSVSGFTGFINPDPGLAQSDFGRVVTAASVTNHFQEEVLISAPSVGRVYVFSGTSLLFAVDGGASFGAAIAIDPRPLGDGDLFAYWVSEPAQNLIHRFIGTERTTWQVPAGLQNLDLGAAMVFDDDANLVIGAPRLSENGMVECGGVFSGPVPLGVDAGTPASCDVGMPCLLGDCGKGRCVGGVFCEYTGSLCSAAEACDPISNMCVAPNAPDAGPPDGGTLDAGSVDAGSVDAGSIDGGSVDGGSADAGEVDAGADAGLPDPLDAGAGELSFTARGCSTGGGTWVMLALLLGRRRNPIE